MDAAGESGRQHEQQEVTVVRAGDALVHPWTVMVESFHATENLTLWRLLS